MNINCIATGSSGNAILVGDGHTRILLDAGISYRVLAKSVRPSDLGGVLITHEHADHSKAACELMRRGISVYMSGGTAENIQKSNPSRHMRYHRIRHLQQVRIGTWDIVAFDIVHDAAEPLGFLFRSNATEKKGIYICDSGYVNYKFEGITHWILEANYSESLLEASGDHPALKRRIRRNHFSFDDVKKFFSESDLSATDEIYLVHMSSRNADEQAFIKELQRLTGVPVYSGHHQFQPIT